MSESLGTHLSNKATGILRDALNEIEKKRAEELAARTATCLLTAALRPKKMRPEDEEHMLGCVRCSARRRAFLKVSQGHDSFGEPDAAMSGVPKVGPKGQPSLRASASFEDEE
jgi:hypothetical protein